LVFVEMPGWQYVGDDIWKAQALQNCREMVCQCRSHPSIFLWGVRVCGSADDESFYKRTNETVRRLDPTRPTAGTRSTRRSQLLEDVYAYTDYSYRARRRAARPALPSPPTPGKAISSASSRAHSSRPSPSTTSRTAWRRRCAMPLSSTTPSPSRAWPGSFGWCMTDYNTHRDSAAATASAIRA
jgi:Beta-galactosidase/beta-glucuronidase